MFSAEKLLGGLLSGSTRSRGGGLGGLVSGGAALGMLGVAMEAVEHFMNKPQGAAPSGMPAAPPPSAPSYSPGAAPPPSPGGPAGAPPPFSGSAPRPVSPPPVPGASVPPPTSSVADQSAGSKDAVLLIQAMIAAANADGQIDQQERNNILERLKAVSLSPEEHSFIFQELLSPASLDAIVSRVSTAEMARQVYTVSLMAIDVDTDAEQNYMETLARRLGLEGAAVDEIHRRLGLA